jgi:hypothetical protein
VKEKIQIFVHWLAIGLSLLWLAGVSLLFSNSTLTEGWLTDFTALVVFGLVVIWATWWILRAFIPK